MSKKRAPARSSTVPSPAFGAPSAFGSPAFGSPSALGGGAFSNSSSLLSYVTEPPNLSDIPDPHMVVLFKNLLKKDEKTKAKALEELQGMLEPRENIEDGVITAWVKLYPRLSIDVARRVRQLANAVQGVVALKSGKKIAKHMATLVGPWLAGLYDPDTTVSRATADSLVAVFKTQEKLKNIWKLYESTILDYCTDVLSNESVYSLSDERNVSADDAEGKYARVMATSVMCATRLIAVLPENGPDKLEDGYKNLVGTKAVWEFAAHADPSLRTAVYRFLVAVLEKRPQWVEDSRERIATAMIRKAGGMSQIGSVEPYLEALEKLTRTHPQAWRQLKAKKSGLSYLAAFIETGSQLAPPRYWGRMSALLGALLGDLAKEYPDNAKKCVQAVVNAVQNGSEPRTHIPEAWKCYIEAVYRLQEVHQKEGLFTEMLAPAYTSYVKGNPKLLGCSINDWASVGARGLQQLANHDSATKDAFLKEVWTHVETLVVGLAESEDTQKLEDQESLKKVVDSWIKLTAEVTRIVEKETGVYNIIRRTNARILTALAATLEKVNGNSEVLADFIERLLQEVGDEVHTNPEARSTVQNFFSDRLRGMLSSPAAEPLLGALVIFGKGCEADSFQAQWNSVLNGLLVSSLDKTRKESCIQKLLLSGSRELTGKVRPVDELDSYIVNKLNAALLSTDSSAWTLPKAALGAAGGVVSKTVLRKILSAASEVLKNVEGDPRQIENALGALERSSLEHLSEFVYIEEASLVGKLLLVSNVEDEALAMKADAVIDRILNGLLESSAEEQEKGLLTVADAVCESVRSDIVPISYLASTAKKLVTRAPEGREAALYQRFLFAEEQWKSAIDAVISSHPNVALAITNPLAGAVYLVDGGETAPLEEEDDSPPSAPSALRMVMFVLEFLEDVKEDALPAESLEVFAYYLALAEELAKDAVTKHGANNIWKLSDGPAEELSALVEKAHQRIAATITSSTVTSRLLERLEKESQGWKGTSFFAARALSSLMSSFLEQNDELRCAGTKWLEETDLWKSEDVFLSTGYLTGAGSYLKPARRQRICNELVSSLSGTSSADAGVEGLRRLVLLNAALPGPDEEPLSIPQPRVVRLVNHLLSWFDEEDTNITGGLISEVLKVLQKLVPLIEDMFGEHWQSMFELLRDFWTGISDLMDDRLPVILSTLKLFSTLKSMVGKNDDLDEAWVEINADLYRALINNILSAARLPDSTHQPLSICYTQLARQLEDVDTGLIEDVSTIYPLLGIPSRPIQQIAYNLLHKAIPKIQESLSVEAALDPNLEISLPAELLSLILDAPSSPLPEDHPDSLLPTRGYLLSWVLIFSQFQNSSFKVRSAFVDTLKDGKYLPSLLDFIVTILCPPTAKPYDASKLSVTEYSALPDPALDFRALLVHVYYLVLRFTPSLAKSWKRDLKNRAVVVAVESFTEKHISPALIEEELSAVSEWAAKRREESDGDEEDLQVKVSRSVREVAAVYPVDDQTMEMVVRMPANYPLDMVTIEGTRRVGLDENHFKRLMMASQAVVNFQSGSIIDALSIFRKNVSLHFQGIEECSICYSILAVTPDRALPTRACQTCRNKFHSSCLVKWFRTSNSSSCPLCRSSFSFYS